MYYRLTALFFGFFFLISVIQISFDFYSFPPSDTQVVYKTTPQTFLVAYNIP